MGKISINEFGISYGKNKIYDNFNISFEEGKITAVLGNSGSGKTSILNAIAGLIPYKGQITGVKEDKAYVFQNQILLANLTVFKNIEYVLLNNKIKDKKSRKEVIDNILKAVNLYDAKDKYPAELSVGMAQRVAMARAFCFEGDLILLDEPFRGLDIGIKSKLIDYFLLLWQQKKSSCIFVTHNIEEALLLSDEIFVIGNLPVEIIANFKINTPKTKRNLSDFELAEIYQKIFTIFKLN